MCSSDLTTLSPLMTYRYVFFSADLPRLSHFAVLQLSESFHTHHQSSEKRFFPLDTPFFQVCSDKGQRIFLHFFMQTPAHKFLIKDKNLLFAVCVVFYCEFSIACRHGIFHCLVCRVSSVCYAQIGRYLSAKST